MADPEIEALANKYRSGSQAPANDIDIKALADKYRSTPVSSPEIQAAPEAAPEVSPVKEKVRTGIGSLERFPGMIPSFGMGAVDVGGSLQTGAANITDSIDRLLKNPNRNLGERTQENIDRVNKLYKEKFEDLPGSGVGRVAGQIAASAPLIPGGLIAQGMKTTFRAAPTVIQSTGKTVKAAIGNRLGASMATGAIAGGEFGALTSASNEDSLAENVGKNALGGAVGGPVVEGAAGLASKTTQFARNFGGNWSINRVANKYGITPQAARDVMKALDNEGIPLAEAEAKLAAFGPDATIGDLTPALQQFIGAMGKRGELDSRAANIVKNRYANRADAADDKVLDVINNTLGPHKDIALERGHIIGGEAEKIHQAAQNATSGDRQAAYANPTKLSVYNLIGDINTKLEKVAGDAIPALEKAKGTLYKNVVDPATGQKVPQVRTSVEDLHESRKALDDMIEKAQRGDSMPSRALAHVKEIRNKVDEQLKTISEMVAHDAKFAKEMDVKEGLKIGYEALSKGNRFSFDKAWNNAASSPRKQQAIQDGMRAYIGDQMDKAANGDLSAAIKMFENKRLSRDKLVQAFGKKGEEALDAIEKHVTMRATERYAATGAITNAATRINSALDVSAAPKGAMMDAAQGAILDVLAGTGGSIAAISGAKRYGGNIRDRMRVERHDLNVESLADMVSRSGAERDAGLQVLKTIDRVHKKLQVPLQNKLPVGVSKVLSSIGDHKVVLSAPIGEPTTDKIKETGNYTGKLVKHWYSLLPDL